MVRIDRNTKLCSKDIQVRIKIAIDVLTRDSLDYIVKHNLVEKAALEKALCALSELVTTRTNQYMWDTKLH